MHIVRRPSSSILCPRAQINGGEAQPNWYKLEYKRAKQENDGDKLQSLRLMQILQSQDCKVQLQNRSHSVQQQQQ